MLDNGTKKRIDSARDILVGKVPDPKSQVEQITIAMIYKFMDDMDNQTEGLGGKAAFFAGEFKQYAWSRLLDHRLSGHERLLFYAEGIEKMNMNENIPQLFRDIFKGAFLPYRDPETLNLFLKEINDFTYDHSERLGDAFEYLLSVLSSQGDAGQFRTPRHIIDFIVEIVNPSKEDSVLDPACGTAGFLISSYKHIVSQNTKNRPGDLLTTDDKGRLMTNFCGYDISPDMVRLSLVNMYLHSFANPLIYEYDTLTSEDRWDERYDVILANPPFMTPKGGIRPHSRFTIKAKRSEVLFVDYIAEHLNVHGRAGVIVPEGIIFQSQNAYKNLRKMLLEDGYLYAVISLPAGVFQPYSGVKTSILLMDKTLAKKTEEILFVKVANDGFDLGAQRRPIDKSDLPQGLEIVKVWKQAIVEGKSFGLDEADKTIAHSVSKKRIAESGDYNLSGDRYREVISYENVKWPMVELGEMCDLIGGGTPSKSVKHYWQNGTIKWISARHIDTESHIVGYELISESAVENSSTKVIPKDAVVFVTRVSVGKIATTNDKYAINQDLTGIVIRDASRATNRYVFHALKHLAETITNAAEGLGVKGVTRKYISNVKIPLPTLEVQEKIVTELDGYQKIVDGAKQIVENYKPIIKIDPDWPPMELKNVCNQITDGTHRTPKYTNKGIPFWRVTDLTHSDSTKKFISRKEHAQLIKRCKPEKGDVLYSKNGTIGVAKLINWDWAFSIFVSLALLKVNKCLLNPKYLEYFLNTSVALDQANSFSKSGTVTNLHLVEIRRIKIPLPSLSIQQKIVAEIESECELVEANKKLIYIFEEKIKDKIGEVWGE